VLRLGGRFWREWLPAGVRGSWQGESSLWRRIASGAFWEIAGASILNAFTLASNVACGRLLGPTRFGEFGILLATANLFLTFAGTGLGMTASRYIAEHRNSDQQSAGRIIGLCSATALVVGVGVGGFCLGAAPWLSARVLNAPQLAGGLVIVSAILLFAAVNASQTGILGGLEAFRTIAIGNAIRGVGLLVLVTAGAALFGLHGALLGYTAAGVAITIYFRFAIWRLCKSLLIKATYRFKREDLRILHRFTLPVLLATFSYTPAIWWSNVLLARTSGYAEAGIFNAVMQCQFVILFFATATSNISLPTLSNVLAEGDRGKYKRCLTANFLVTTVPAIAAAVPIAIAAPFIMSLYGPAFAHGANAVRLISVSAVFFAINSPVNHAMWSLEAAGPGVLLSLVRGGTLVIGAYALVGKGAWGLALAYMLVSIAQVVVGLPWLGWLMRRKFSTGSTAAVPVSLVAR